MRRTVMHLTPLVLLGTMLAACGGDKKPAADSAKPDSAAAKPVAAAAPVFSDTAWTPLIDSTMSQWRDYNTDTMPKGWTVRDGVLSKTGAVADLESRPQYGNFEIEFDWKIGKAGNAGFFYRGTNEYEKIYWSAPEYQLLDNARHPDRVDTLRIAASAYALYAPYPRAVKPATQWNAARIRIHGDSVEHWLNGQKVVAYVLKGADWTARVKAAKFKDYPNYGLASQGYFAIQGDHDGTLSIRGMRVRALP